jgi:hypothetical protein
MAREVFDSFPAGGPYGSWPADEKAAELTASGTPATVRMDIDSDRFIVVPQSEGDR